MVNYSQCVSPDCDTSYHGPLTRSDTAVHRIIRDYGSIIDNPEVQHQVLMGLTYKPRRIVTRSMLSFLESQVHQEINKPEYNMLNRFSHIDRHELERPLYETNNLVPYAPKMDLPHNSNNMQIRARENPLVFIFLNETLTWLTWCNMLQKWIFHIIVVICRFVPEKIPLVFIFLNKTITWCNMLQKGIFHMIVVICKFVPEKILLVFLFLKKATKI
ncbi:hypothetical protein CDAR_15051 [Caerostris darwini]|uniref:Uncharacterized protein n=1 Tax=Caerostris darwini TaxID=1538125 RepID=A0AAV4P8V9_9ARAC|nr:hypothetical protein CDAR_15051 [Caerostris darwini]